MNEEQLKSMRNERSFYCSKLVWMAWLKQGYDFDVNAWNGGVWPWELRESSKTVEY